MGSSTPGGSRREIEEVGRSNGRHKKYPKHVHYEEDEECVPYDEDQSYPRLPPSDPARITKLRGQLQNNDLFPFSIEECSDDDAFFAAFKDSGEEGTHLRRLDSDGFNEIMSCPRLARQNSQLPTETFERRARKRGRDSAALQLALRLFCGNYEQHYGSLADQRLVDFPPTVASEGKRLQDSSKGDAFQCTKANARFRAEQFEYEKVNPTSKSNGSNGEQTKDKKLPPSIIDPTAWSGVQNANKEIEGILLQRLLWKILAMATRRINQGGDSKSLEERFVQSRWDAIVTCQTNELRYKLDTQGLVFKYIACLLGEEYQLGPNFTGRVYDYSVSSSMIRMLNSLATADGPSSIQTDIREKALCPVAMRILYLFSETSDNKGGEKQGTATKYNENESPPEERVEYFKKQRQSLRETTPRWKSKGKYLSFKDMVEPIRARLSVSDAAPDVDIMSAMLAVENTRDPKHYDLDYDQIWSFSRELPTYTKVRNFFSLNFYDGELRDGVIDPWEEGSEYGNKDVADYTQHYSSVLGNLDFKVPYIPPPKPQPQSQALSDGSASEESTPEVGSGKIMPLPLIDFDPEKMEAEQTDGVKKWRIARYYPGYSGKFPLPETGFIEAAIGAQIQKDLDEWESNVNNGETRPQEVNAEDVPVREKFKLPNPKLIWTVPPKYPIGVVHRVGRGREVVPLVQLSTQHSTAQATAPTPTAHTAEAHKQGAPKQYKRDVYIPRSIRRSMKEQQQPRKETVTTSTTAAKAEPATAKPSKMSTVSVKKRDKLSLKDYKPLPQKQAAIVLKVRKKEKRLPGSSPPKEKNQPELQRFENSTPKEKETTTEPQSSSPKSRIVGTGYRHLPASNSNKPTFPPTGQPSALPAEARENIKALTPVLAKLTAKDAEGKHQVKSLYPWLPSDRAHHLPLENLGVAFKRRKTKMQMPRVRRHKGKERSKEEKRVELEE